MCSKYSNFIYNIATSRGAYSKKVAELCIFDKSMKFHTPGEIHFAIIEPS